MQNYENVEKLARSVKRARAPVYLYDRIMHRLRQPATRVSAGRVSLAAACLAALLLLNIALIKDFRQQAFNTSVSTLAAHYFNDSSF